MRPFPKVMSTAFAAFATVGAVGWALFREAEPLRLVTQVYPPYQIINGDGSLGGSSVETMRCALNGLGQEYTLAIVSGSQWEQAQQDTKAGKFDGFFGALFTAPRSKWASWTTALDVSRAYYVRRKDHDSDHRDPDMRWGVKAGSGIQKTIEASPYRFTMIAPDNPQLVKALHDWDVDWIYIDVLILQWASSVNGYEDEPLAATVGSPNFEFDTRIYHLEPASDQLYGAYFSHAFLNTHPSFLDRFNVTAGACRQAREVSK